MKKILLSVHPKYCELIFSGKKTIEVRRTRPKLEPPFEVLVYETKGQFIKSVKGACTTYGYGRGKVIGSFICDKIDVFDSEWSEYAYACAPTDIPCAMPMSEEKAIKICKEKGSMTLEDIIDYFGDEEWRAYFWHITEPKLFDKSRELSEFSVYGKCAEECSEYDICMKYDSVESRFECPDFTRMLLKRAPQSWCYVDD